MRRRSHTNETVSATPGSLPVDHWPLLKSAVTASAAAIAVKFAWFIGTALVNRWPIRPELLWGFLPSVSVGVDIGRFVRLVSASTIAAAAVASVLVASSWIKGSRLQVVAGRVVGAIVVLETALLELAIDNWWRPLTYNRWHLFACWVAVVAIAAGIGVVWAAYRKRKSLNAPVSEVTLEDSNGIGTSE